MNKILIIWDKLPDFMGDENNRRTYFRDFLLSPTKNHNLTNPETGLEIIDEEEGILSPRGELPPGINWGYNAIIVLAELKWRNHSRTEFFGFDIVGNLRLQGILCPIYICSWMPKTYFYQQAHLKFGVLKGPGHYYIRLPYSKVDLKAESEEKYLTLPLLADLQYYLLDLEGRINEIFHNIKGRMRNGFAEQLDTGFVELKKLIHPSKWEQLAQVRKDIKIAISEDSEKNPGTILYQHKKSVLSLVSKTKEKNEEAFPAIKDWLILFVDDQEEVRQLLAWEFGERGIQCLLASSGKEVFEILKLDAEGKLPKQNDQMEGFWPANSVTVLISDWRFHNDEGEWEYYQGYEIINHVYHGKHLEYGKANMLAFFILTSKKGGIIRNLSKGELNKISWFAKEDVFASENSLNLFAYQVIQEGERVLEAVLNQPTRASWTNGSSDRFLKPLAEYYRHHRMSRNYLDLESRISKEASRLIKIAEGVRSGSLDYTTARFPTVWTEKLKKKGIDNPFDPEFMGRFRLKLIGRRVVIGLRLKGWKVGEINSMMKFGFTTEKIARENEKDSDFNAQIFNTHLAMGKDLEKYIHQELLIEEKNWIRNHLKLSLAPFELAMYTSIFAILEEIELSLIKVGNYLGKESFMGEEKLHTPQFIQVHLSVMISRLQKNPEIKHKGKILLKGLLERKEIVEALAQTGLIKTIQNALASLQ